MNKADLRNLMLNEKKLLKTLYEPALYKNKKQILMKSNENQLDVIIYILYFIVEGEIPLKKNHFETLKANKKLSFINSHLNSNAKLQILLKSNFKNKVNFLIKLVRSFENLFFFLFSLS